MQDRPLISDVAFFVMLCLSRSQSSNARIFFILPLLLLSGSPAQLQQEKRNKEEENTNQDDKHYKATGSLGLGSSDHGGVSALT